jgi:polyhydroxybutyrate depolymerase
MALKKYFAIALVVIMAMMLPMASSIPVAAELSSGSSNLTPGLHTGWMTENYTDWTDSTWTCNRTFEYYIPTGFTNSTPVPLLFSFHGLGSTGDAQRDLTKFDELADAEGFIAVFPNATNATKEGISSCDNVTLPPLPGAEIQWNLGAGSLQTCGGVDDVGFVVDMVHWFKANYAINASRIYATGMSDGALFSYLLAFNLTGTFAAIVPVCGPMPWGFDNANFTAAPITVIEIHGTSDPIIYYNGYGGYGGNVTLSVNETIAYWKNVDNITSPAVTTTWNSAAVDPNTQVTRYVYSGGTNGTQVILFKVVNGGHTWPLGPQYAGAYMIGYVDNQIDGSAQIWKYLPPLKYCLTIRSSSTTGTVTTSDPNAFTRASDNKTGVNIRTTTLFFAAGTGPTVVNLTATPTGKYRFVNWTGNVSTIGNITDPTTTITINPNTDYEITANFLAQYDLTTGSTSGGNVTTPGQGIFRYDVGTVVNIVATPASGYHFVSWTGAPVADWAAANTTITMSGDRSVTANFEATTPTPSPSGGCFIATAAYGTPTAKQIDVLRAFRDDVLLKSTVGSRLVDFYYRTSPPIANFISQHSVVRTLVRELLIDPIVWVVQATGNLWQS